MSYKISETRTNFIKVDEDFEDSEYGVIEIKGVKSEISSDVATFIIELIDEVDSMREQLEYYTKNSGMLD